MHPNNTNLKPDLVVPSTRADGYWICCNGNVWGLLGSKTMNPSLKILMAIFNSVKADYHPFTHCKQQGRDLKNLVQKLMTSNFKRNPNFQSHLNLKPKSNDLDPLKYLMIYLGQILDFGNLFCICKLRYLVILGLSLAKKASAQI